MESLKQGSGGFKYSSLAVEKALEGIQSTGQGSVGGHCNHPDETRAQGGGQPERRRGRREGERGMESVHMHRRRFKEFQDCALPSLKG